MRLYMYKYYDVWSVASLPNELVNILWNACVCREYVLNLDFFQNHKDDYKYLIAQECYFDNIFHDNWLYLTGTPLSAEVHACVLIIWLSESRNMWNIIYQTIIGLPIWWLILEYKMLLFHC